MITRGNKQILKIQINLEIILGDYKLQYVKNSKI